MPIAYFLFLQNQHVEALTQYEAALARFVALGDAESVASLRSSTLGLYRILGQTDLASRAAFLGRNYAIHLPDPQRRNRFLGEAALFALELGYGAVARSYQNAIVRALENELNSATRPDLARRLRYNLAIALRGRAGILARLDRFELASEDLQRAIHYGPPREIQDPTSRALQARIEEVRAIALRPRDPEGAVRAFTAAIELAGQDEYSTFRANLFAQRAGALRDLGRDADAEQDLREALRVVREEEAGMLEMRQRGKAEEIWASYFSRFDDTYQVLIRHLVDDDRPEEAFASAEQARAYEPMNLLLRFGVVARDFRDQLGPEQTLSLPRIQQHLPDGTFLIEYAVLDDRTYAWIIGSNTFILRELTARESDVVRWSEELQDSVHRRDTVLFETTLSAAHDGLVAQVLAEIRRRSSGPLRLVIIPDGAMHGLPFAALRNGPARRYLIQEASVSIAPSASFYVHSVLRDRELHRSPHPSALLFGNPDLDPGLAKAHLLVPLRGAEGEVTRIGHGYAPRATVRMGSEATMEEFLRLAAQNDVVHVAAHGLVNERMPFRSSLVLARTEHSDGLMDAETLLTRLKADRTRLMVFSACSSAGGLPVGSHGVAPLVRPILSAGVPGVIGTLWDIEDATSAELMVSFHRHYRQGDDAAIALQRAQVEMLTEKPGIAPAMTWAPFQVIGHASSPFAAPDNNRGEPP
ncbi:MAG: CHAT domain-containing protein [Thermoanaerobaculia bacterium]